MLGRIAVGESARRLLSNFLALSALRGLDFLIPLVTLPYLVRVLGIENFGLISYSASLSFYFGAVIQYGFGISATRDIAINREFPERVQQIYSAVLMSSILMSVLCLGALALIILGVKSFSENKLLHFFTFASVLMQSLFPVWFFQGMERMQFIAGLSIASKLLYLMGLFLFVHNETDYIVVPLINAVASALCLIAAFCLIRNSFGVSFTFPKVKGVWGALQRGKDAFWVQFAPNLYNNSTVFILGMLSSSAVVGHYSAALKVMQALMSLGQILTNVFIPHLSRRPSSHKVFFAIMAGSGFVLCFMGVMLAEYISAALYGEAGKDVERYIRLLSFWVLMIFLRNAVGPGFLMLRGYERQYKNIVLYTSIFALIFAVFAIPKFESLGAVATINIAAFVMTVLAMAFYWRVRRD